MHCRSRQETANRDIPDTLELSEEDKQRIEEFDRNEKERKMNNRKKNGRGGRGQRRGPNQRFSNRNQRGEYSTLSD